MNLDEFRREMASYRRDLNDESAAFKDPWIALDGLRSLYAGLEPRERRMADQVLDEWVLSEDENVRFDALALIHDLKIATAMPSLRALATRLTSSTVPSAPYELKKVNRLIEEFTKPSASEDL
jgi:hypothetical protein